MDSTRHTKALRQAQDARWVYDGPVVPRRGFLESFYGPQWADDDRRTLLTEAASWGMNFYCYGPSGDAHNGALWREPYPDPGRVRLADLAVLGDALGIEVCWRISPCAPLVPSAGIVLHDPAERRLLLQRLDDVLDTGIRTILLAFDDVEHGLFHAADRTVFAGDPHPVAAAHAALARLVGDHLAERDARLVLCPTRYWGTEHDRYSGRLAELLDPAVELCWTGPRVTSARIRAEDAAAASARYGDRPLLLWDNYPVNDWDGLDPDAGYPAQRRLFLGPVRGREPGVAAHLGSYLVNCGAQPLAGLPALATAAQWAWNPVAYDPELAWAAVLERYDDAHGSLAFLASIASSSPLHLADTHPLATAVPRYLAGDGTGSALRAELDRARRQADRAAASSNDQVVLRALGGWAERAAELLAAGGAATSVIDAFRSGDDAELATAAQWLADRRQALDRPFPPAILDAALTPLIERGRGLAGAPVPPHDV